jgi:hypothetical protein
VYLTTICCFYFVVSSRISVLTLIVEECILLRLYTIKHDNHVTLLATIYSCANTRITLVLIFTTCFGRDAPSSGEAEYNTSNYKSLLN